MKKRGRISASAGRRQTLLIVDDDPAVREVLMRVLGDEDYLVLSAANGPDALALAGVRPIDLVLLDLNMPRQSGWDTFEALTAHNPFLAVIIITARPNQIFTAVGAGVGALLEKPLDYDKLLETVRHVLAESRRVRLARLTGHHAGFRYFPSGVAASSQPAFADAGER